MSSWMSWPMLVALQAVPAFVLLAVGQVGRCLRERLVLSVVLSAPIAALLHLVQLSLDATPGTGWILLVVIDAFAIGWLWWRARHAETAVDPAPSPPSSWTLLILLVVILGVYYQTTAVYSRPSPTGELALIRSLQRDTLFHVGMVRAVELAYPPSLLSFGGREVGYHVGYHLQLASWSRLAGIDALDAVLRFGAGLQIALLMLTSYGLGWRLSRRSPSGTRAGWWSAWLVLGGGLGFLFFSIETVDWWSLVFMDAALVSIFLVNPLLPALPLLFAGTMVAYDELEANAEPFEHSEAGGPASRRDPESSRSRRSLFRLSVIAICGGWLLLVKMFLGAQWLASVLMAVVVRRPSKALVRLGIAAAIGAVPAMVHTLGAASASNTAIGVKPFEIMRYAAEKLDWTNAVERLGAVGRFSGDATDWLFAAGFLLFWVVGFLGVRLIAAPEICRRLFGSDPLYRILAWFAVMGFPLTLLFRIAPTEAIGDSRIEAQNDAIWFATQSGVVWWFFLALVVAESMSRWTMGRRVAVSILLVASALPATAQHFFYLREAGVDLVGKRRLEAAEKARSLSDENELWLQSPDRAHPSLIAYWAGRRVVYDPYVGYDYMFVGRRETEWRRHAIAYFWRAGDPGFQSWFLRELGVSWLWSQDDAALGGIRDSLLFREHSTEAVTLWRVVAEPEANDVPIRPPDRVPMTRAGALHLGEGFSPPIGSPPHRRVASGAPAIVYLPHPPGRFQLRLEVVSATGGVLSVAEGGSETIVTSGRSEVFLESVDFPEEGFSEITLRWESSDPVEIFSLMLERAR